MHLYRRLLHTPRPQRESRCGPIATERLAVGASVDVEPTAFRTSTRCPSKVVTALLAQDLLLLCQRLLFRLRTSFVRPPPEPPHGDDGNQRDDRKNNPITKPQIRCSQTLIRA